MRDSDWLLLETLRRCKNLSAAAQQLYMTQPALSKQLVRIEHEFGITIAVRTSKGIALTDDGEYIAAKAGEILALIREAREHFADAPRASLLIGSSNTFARFTLLEHLKEYQKEYPSAMIFLTCAVSDQVLKLVETHSVDIGFIRGEYRHSLVQVPISRDKGWIVTSREVTMDELSRTPFIQHSRDGYTIRLIRQWWDACFDVPLNIGTVVNDTATSYEMIKREMGFGIFFNDYLREASGLCRMQMTDRHGLPVERSTFMIYRKGEEQHPDSKRFIQFIEKNIKKPGKKPE